MLIYSYIAVLHMASQRPPRLLSISSKYPSPPAAHGDGAVLPSVLTGLRSLALCLVAARGGWMVEAVVGVSCAYPVAGVCRDDTNSGSPCMLEMGSMLY